MDTELLKLKIKKYLSQYEYLVNEYEETQYLFEKYKKIFYSECPQNLINNNNNEKNNKEDLNNNKPEYLQDKIDTEIDKDSNKDSYILKIVSKVYKKLCLKTHPDKSPLYNKEFEEISKAYNKKDFLKLLLLSRKLNIDIDYILNEHHNNRDENTMMSNNDSNDCNDYTEIFEESIRNINEKISNIKTTLAWNWALSNDDQKNQLREKFLN